MVALISQTLLQVLHHLLMALMKKEIINFNPMILRDEASCLGVRVYEVLMRLTLITKEMNFKTEVQHLKVFLTSLQVVLTLSRDHLTQALLRI